MNIGQEQGECGGVFQRLCNVGLRDVSLRYEEIMAGELGKVCL